MFRLRHPLQDVCLDDFQKTLGADSVALFVMVGGAASGWASAEGKIAFISNGGGDFDIYVLDVDSHNQVRFTLNGGGNPDWSLDREKIVFAARWDADVESQ